MGLSYNPSSFATNKTILEAIEELKKYLIANPLACIYQVPGGVTPDIRSLYLTSITIPTGQEIKPGDLLIAMNGYYNFVDSVSETNVYFDDDWCNLSLDVQSITLNFDSTYGEVVNTPANFTGWIYRRFPRTSDRYYRGRRYYLEITYKDSTAFPTTQTATIFIPSNYLNAIWYQLNVDNSTTIYFDFTEDPEQQIYQLTDFTIPAGQNGADGNDGVSITGATIDASNHLILTLSDGNTIDAGALPTPSEYTHTVTISTTSGTFSDSDFALLGYGDSVIIYDDGSIKTAYKLKLETASVYEFECIDATSKNNLKLIDVNKTTKAYSMTAVAMIKSATFDSGTATSGKVLTANGSGGTSWETPSGGLNHYSTSSGTYALASKLNLCRNVIANGIPVEGNVSIWVDGSQTKSVNIDIRQMYISEGYQQHGLVMEGTYIDSSASTTYIYHILIRWNSGGTISVQSSSYITEIASDGTISHYTPVITERNIYTTISYYASQEQTTSY